MISLWGFMGSGKSTVGAALADRHHWIHLDADEQIEQRENMHIKDMFAQFGEGHFRKLETQYLHHLLHQLQLGQLNQRTVLTTGGGMPIRTKNRTLLQKLGPSIYLHVPFVEIIERLKQDQDRPLWNQNQLEEMEKRYNQRLSYYQQADHMVDAEQKSVLEIVEDIHAYLKRL